MIEYDREALARARVAAVALAEAEQLPAHGDAIEARFSADTVSSSGERVR